MISQEEAGEEHTEQEQQPQQEQEAHHQQTHDGGPHLVDFRTRREDIAS